MMQLNLARIEDQATRSTFQQIQENFNENPVNLAGFKMYEITTTAAVTNRVISHNLGFIPRDVIVTRISGGTVTWAYDSFTKETITFTTSAAVKIRFLLGSLT